MQQETTYRTNIQQKSGFPVDIFERTIHRLIPCIASQHLLYLSNPTRHTKRHLVVNEGDDWTDTIPSQDSCKGEIQFSQRFADLNLYSNHTILTMFFFFFLKTCF